MRRRQRKYCHEFNGNAPAAGDRTGKEVYSKKYPFHIILLSRKNCFFDIIKIEPVHSTNGDHELKIRGIMLKKWDAKL